MGRKPKLTPHQVKEALRAARPASRCGTLPGATTSTTARFRGLLHDDMVPSTCQDRGGLALSWEKVREEALVRAGRHCCICHKFCGIKMEAHHIIERGNGGPDTFDNCIVLCFDCHGDMRSYDFKHPKGINYTPSELKKHRDNWYRKVAETPGQNSEASRVFPADIMLYRRLSERLPWDGPMTWLDSFDFAGAFRNSLLEPFNDTLYNARNPLNEFFDADLEGLRAIFISKIEKWQYLITCETFILETDDAQGDFRRKLHFVDEVHHAQTQKSINNAANECVKAYRNLVREAELRLRGSM